MSKQQSLTQQYLGHLENITLHVLALMQGERSDDACLFCGAKARIEKSDGWPEGTRITMTHHKKNCLGIEARAVALEGGLIEGEA